MTKTNKRPIGQLVVTQSNSLIEADYSQTNFSVNDLKFGRLILGKLNPKDDQSNRLVYINITDYRRYMGYKMNTPYGRLNADIKKHCLALNSQVISIALDDGSVLNAFFISSYRIDKNNQRIEVELSGQLKPHLLQLKSNYTSYKLWNIPRLDSGYSIRMYELLGARRRFGKRFFEVEDLKAKLGCTYPQYGIFKRRAILKAQKDTLENTDLRFEFEEHKTGRKITGLTFYIYPNDPEVNEVQQVFAFVDVDEREANENGFDREVMEAFAQLGISKANLEKMLTEGWDIIEDEEARRKAQKRCRTLFEYYGEKLTLLQQSKAQKSPAGFFIKALKEDWQNPVLSKKKEVARANRQKEANKRKLRKLEDEKDKASRELDQLTRKAVISFYADKESDLMAIIDQVLPVGKVGRRSVKASLTAIQNYQESPIVSAMVNGEIKKTNPSLLEHLEEKTQALEALRTEIEALKLKM